MFTETRLKHMTGASSRESIIYEVTLDVDPQIADEYLTWLKEHVREMMTLGHFHRAVIHELLPDHQNRKRWTVHYHAPSQAALDVYLEEHAPRMRQHGFERFDGRFSAERRIFRRLAEY